MCSQVSWYIFVYVTPQQTLTERNKCVLLISFAWKHLVQQVIHSIKLIQLDICKSAEFCIGQKSIIVQNMRYIFCVHKLPSSSHLCQSFAQNVIWNMSSYRERRSIAQYKGLGITMSLLHSPEQ